MGRNKWAEMNGPKLSGPSCTGPKFSGTKIGFTLMAVDTLNKIKMDANIFFTLIALQVKQLVTFIK